MKEEILKVTIRQDTFIVFETEITSYSAPSITYLYIPWGILRPDYSLLNLEIERKEVTKP